LFGLLVHGFCLIASLLIVNVLGLLCVFWGACLAIYGRDACRPFTFPVLFLVFMAPLPHLLYQPLTVRLQILAAELSEFTLQAGAVAVYQQGAMIRVPGHELQVGAGCSGLHSLMAIVALALASGHLSGRSIFYTATLLACSVLVVILANSLRVTLTALVILWIGEDWAQGVYHMLEGWGMFLLTTGLVLLVAWQLSRWFPCRSAHESS
jgi:exosortase